MLGHAGATPGNRSLVPASLASFILNPLAEWAPHSAVVSSLTAPWSLWRLDLAEGALCCGEMAAIYATLVQGDNGEHKLIWSR